VHAEDLVLPEFVLEMEQIVEVWISHNADKFVMPMEVAQGPQKIV